MKVNDRLFPAWFPVAPFGVAHSQLPVLPPHWTAFLPFWKVQLPLEAELPGASTMLLPPSMIATFDTKKPEVGPPIVSVAVPVPMFRVAV